METLNELVRGHSLPRGERDGEKETLQRLEAMLTARPYHCERAAVDKAMSSLAQEYFRNRLEKRYARLSDELFELEREIRITPEHVNTENSDIKSVEKIAPATIPLLADVMLGKWSWSYDGHTTATVTYRSHAVGDKHKVNFSVEADAPPLTPDVKHAGAEAMAYVYEMCAEAMRSPTMRDYIGRNIAGDRAPENEMLAKLSPMLRVLWKPTEESMKTAVDTTQLRDPDPALLLYFNEDSYVVTTWDVKHEEPFRHYLAEFTAPRQKKLRGMPQ